MTEFDRLLGEWSDLMAKAEPLAPWLPDRIENMRDREPHKRPEKELRTRVKLLRLNVRVAEQSLEAEKPPRWTDIMDPTGLRPRPYVGEICPECKGTGQVGEWDELANRPT